MKTLTSHSLSYPDPYYKHIDRSQLTVEFSDYQDYVRFPNFRACTTAAIDDAIQKISAGQGDNPMGPGPYAWSSDDATLYLSPEEQLTWAQWSQVPATIGLFMLKNDWKGTQFIILHRRLGAIGSGQLTAHRSSQSSVTMRPFPDPYDKHIAHSRWTMEFYGYRGSISAVAMRDCIGLASNDVVRHLLSDEVPMSQEAASYSYSAGGVNLFLSPGERLTWHMWAFVPIWIQEFVTENDFKGTQFVLLWEGIGEVGFGQLVSELKDTLS